MNCPACGSQRIASNGPNYKCKERECGKLFRKIFRRRRVPPEERPPCPECGVENPYSNAPRGWICRVCGRGYTNESKITESINSGVVSMNNLEVQVE